MHKLCLQAFVILFLSLEYGWAEEAMPYSYLPEQLPNPQHYPRACGLGNTPGYICDPNGILSRFDLNVVKWHLDEIANTEIRTHCPCSWYHCEHTPAPHFYKVAIALIPSLRLPQDTTGKKVTPLDQAQTFAYRLEHSLWNISSCEEDIVILYSRDDQILATVTGSTAGRRLNDQSRQIIHGIVGEHFRDGRIVEGLNRMLYEIYLVLNGNRYHDYQVDRLVQSSSVPISAAYSLNLVLCISSFFSMAFTLL